MAKKKKEDTVSDNTGISMPLGEQAGLDAGDFEGTERTQIYENYNKMAFPDSPPIEEPQKEGETEEKPDTAKEEVKEPEKPIETTETATEKAETVVETEPPKEEIKTVPYGALKEERERRKTLQKQIEEYEARQRQLIQDNMRFIESAKKPEEEMEFVYKPEISTLKAELDYLRRENEAIKKRFQTDDELKQQQNLENLINEVDKAELEAGRPGFKSVGQHLVLARIQELASQDPEKASIYQNPDGWKLLWQQEYPKLRQTFIEEKKHEISEQKRQAKLNAGLVSSTGKVEQTVSKDKEWSYDDYLKERAKIQAY